MDDKTNCKISACCKANWCGILGIILVVLASILTIITFSGLGIFGMFLVGVMMCCHKHMSWKTCGNKCGCGCACCGSSDDVVCDVSGKNQVGVENKTTPKKSNI